MESMGTWSSEEVKWLDFVHNFDELDFFMMNDPWNDLDEWFILVLPEVINSVEN